MIARLRSDLPARRPTPRWVCLFALALVASALASACSGSEDVGQLDLPVAALCTVPVATGGSTQQLATEDDYVPHVVACEHGSATQPATLMAQAVAARTYAYYKVTVEKKTLTDGQGDQVYSCAGRNLEDLSATQQARIKKAVSDTRGQILTHTGLIIAAFYVAGSKTQNTSCVPSASESSATEKYVTYNEGKTGTAVKPTSLGSSSSPRNRGCLSQWGALCLADKKSYDYVQTLRFYYGADITLDAATGSCGGPPPPTCIPKPELCNGKDDDCNGQIDDGNPSGGAVCLTGKSGPCAWGVSVCQGGSLICTQTVFPKSEVCNHVDDDCNGTIDDAPGGCGGACVPSPEVCNGIDDDCNGQIDEGNPQGGQTCYTGGACPVGVTTCTANGLICQPTPQVERCDGLDNDCNGQIDDVPGGCGGPPAGDGPPTDSGVSPPSCVATPERCNGLDDDCDGFPDEDNPEGGGACSIAGPAGFVGVLACVGGKLVCWSTNPGGSPNPVVPPKSSDQLSGGCSVRGAGHELDSTVLLVLLGLIALRFRVRRYSA